MTAEICLKRMASPALASTDDFGMNGFFLIPFKGQILRCMVSDGEAFPEDPWEHVSVSLSHRCPTWDEMCFIKDSFWQPEEVALQFHPKHSEYVNMHPFCLHLWRPGGREILTPPSIFVGIKSPPS